MTCVQFSIRTSSVLICCTYLVFHAAFLVINFIILSDTASHLGQIAAVTPSVDILDGNLRPSHLNIEAAEKYLLLPILLNIVLIISNLLAAWGALILNHLLLLPWLAFYFTYILFAFGLLLYMVIVLYHVWFKIVIFLIVSPILILAIIFWLTLLELYFLIKIHNSRKAKFSQQSKLAAVVSKPRAPSSLRTCLVPPLPADNFPPRKRKVVKKQSFIRGVHRPIFRRSEKKTNLRHRSYRHRSREGQGRQSRRQEEQEKQESSQVKEEEVTGAKPECEDSLEEDPTTGHHYQVAGDSHYQTPKMSRCQPGFGSNYCISLLSTEKNMMRGDDEITVDWRQTMLARPAAAQ